MRRFAALFESLDTTTSTAAKTDAMVAYFGTADPADAAWAVFVLIGNRLKRTVGPAQLRKWLIEEANLPNWLVEETYASVGDLAETIALLVPNVDRIAAPDISLTEWLTAELRLCPAKMKASGAGASSAGGTSCPIASVSWSRNC